MWDIYVLLACGRVEMLCVSPVSVIVGACNCQGVCVCVRVCVCEVVPGILCNPKPFLHPPIRVDKTPTIIV